MKIQFLRNWQSGTYFGAFYKGATPDLPEKIARRAIRQGAAIKIESPESHSASVVAEEAPAPVVVAPDPSGLPWASLRVLYRDRTGKWPKTKDEALALLSNKARGAAPENKSALAG